MMNETIRARSRALVSTVFSNTDTSAIAVHMYNILSYVFVTVVSENVSWKACPATHMVVVLVDTPPIPHHALASASTLTNHNTWYIRLWWLFETTSGAPKIVEKLQRHQSTFETTTTVMGTSQELVYIRTRVLLWKSIRFWTSFPIASQTPHK